MTTGALPDTMENMLLDGVLGTASYVATTTPVKARLMTTNGNDSTNGTQVVGGSYVAQTVTFAAASGGATANSGALNYTGMPACTVTGIELWDSAGTPKRLFWGALPTPKVVNAGDTFQVAAGQITAAID